MDANIKCLSCSAIFYLVHIVASTWLCASRDSSHWFSSKRKLQKLQTACLAPGGAALIALDLDADASLSKLVYENLLSYEHFRGKRLQ